MNEWFSASIVLFISKWLCLSLNTQPPWKYRSLVPVWIALVSSGLGPGLIVSTFFLSRPASNHTYEAWVTSNLIFGVILFVLLLVLDLIVLAVARSLSAKTFIGMAVPNILVSLFCAYCAQFVTAD